MSEFNLKDLESLKWLIDLKNNKPDEYKKFLADIKDIYKDLMKMLVEIQNHD